MRNAKCAGYHKPQWGGPTVHSSTVISVYENLEKVLVIVLWILMQ